PTGVMVAPLIPGLNDRDVAQVLERAAACGAQRAAYVPLRLPGSVREVFLSRLRASLPDRAARVEHHIREMRGGRLNDSRFGARMRGEGVYWGSLRQLFDKTASRLGLRGEEDDPDITTDHTASAKDRASIQLPLF